MFYLNLLIRGGITIFGLLLVLGQFSLGKGENIDLSFGIVITLFGIYRLVLLITKRSEYHGKSNRD